MKAYSLKIPFPKVVYCINLEISTVTSSKHKNEPADVIDPLLDRELQYEHDKIKVQAIEMVQTRF